MCLPGVGPRVALFSQHALEVAPAGNSSPQAIGSSQPQQGHPGSHESLRLLPRSQGAVLRRGAERKGANKLGVDGQDS